MNSLLFANTDLRSTSYLLTIEILKKALQNEREENEGLRSIIIQQQTQISNAYLLNQIKSLKIFEENPTAFKENESSEAHLKSKLTISKQDLDTSPNFKEEISQENAESTDKSENNSEHESPFMSPDLCLKAQDEIFFEDMEDNKSVVSSIRRRNGFKKDNESKNKDKSKIKRSKAKHLWITYGRKIIDYAVEKCDRVFKERIEKCEKLTSKKGYSEVFMIRKKDDETEKDFKRSFASLAFEFLENETENAFLNSNYRDELLSQKEKVRIWIEKQIREN